MITTCPKCGKPSTISPYGNRLRIMCEWHGAQYVDELSPKIREKYESEYKADNKEFFKDFNNTKTFDQTKREEKAWVH